ncbi:uncharacterized protein LOC126560447 [Anopheles maculipalpis]|uniref:uncharacterized protein LOC126560447 n=1 Tax=Anopheles maculipalpis TaxID=1496333 RepID=UPI002158F691|nr:uncharacterized protein LOC126560447 [Anopheles maculipalpis]
MAWEAVVAGDSQFLQKLSNENKEFFCIGTLTDRRYCTILHHAVMSENLDVVKWVVEHCKPNMAAQNEDGLTPLMLACEQLAAVELIIYLYQQELKDEACMEAYDYISPLYYAVYQDRLDLAQQLIANGVKVDDLLLRDPSSPLSIVATVTCNTEMLQCLLDAANVQETFAAGKDDGGPTMLDVFAESAVCSAEQKVACFKILYNLVYPVPAHVGTERIRYQVEDILKLALLSVQSESLIPHFIETERKWEMREDIRSLYERLIPKYEMLAMFVLCECGPVSMDRVEVLGSILRSPSIRDLLVSGAGVDLLEMYISSILPDEQYSTPDAQQLLEDFASFAKRIKLECLRNAIQTAVSEALVAYRLTKDKPLMSTREQFAAYQPIIDCMVSMCSNNTVDAIAERLLSNESLLTRPDLVFPLLKHCCSLLTVRDSMETNQPTRLFQFFIHLFGTWKAVECFSTPRLSVFSLKRLARDTVREAVWYGMDAMQTTQRSSPFFDRLQSLDIPNEMKGYLRYSDYTSVNYFLCHLHETIDYLRETRRLD